MRVMALITTVALALMASAASAQSPPPPDYAQDKAWICRPGRDDACAVDLSTRSELSHPSPGRDPAIDCFYVYPTISTASGDNAPIAVTEDEARAVRLQLARLRSVCRLYAPLYRQLTVSDMKRRLEGGQTPNLPAAMAMAESDVAAAWTHYLEHDNAGRGVVLIGHSQGALILQGLIHEQFDGQPLMARLVSAVLPGSFVTAPIGEDVGGTFKAIPACRTKDQIGCVITFNSFRDDAPPPEGYEGMLEEDERALCTNPAALGGERATLRPYFAQDGGTIIPWFSAPRSSISEGQSPFVSPAGISGECVNELRGGYLAVTTTPEARTYIVNGDFVFEGERDAAMGLHLIDLELVMGDLIEVVWSQARAYAARTNAL